jgi:Membrane carboxypeptidase/penicillin-binding protein
MNSTLKKMEIQPDEARKPGLVRRWLKRLLWACATLFLLSSTALIAFYLYVAKDVPTAAEFRQSCLSMTITEPGGGMYPRPLAEIPPLVIKAFLAAEDSAYYQRPGLGFWEYMRINWHLAFGPGMFYEPPLAQQLAGKADMGAWNRRPTSWGRIYSLTWEALLTARLERDLSKDEVLEFYLNRVYLGRGAYGVEAAARILLGKTITEISIAEAAQLASLQRTWPVDELLGKPERLKVRRFYILHRMLYLEYITEEEAGAANEEEIVLNIKAQ